MTAGQPAGFLRTRKSEAALLKKVDELGVRFGSLEKLLHEAVLQIEFGAFGPSGVGRTDALLSALEARGLDLVIESPERHRPDGQQPMCQSDTPCG